ncbi:hypothetical protein ATCC90586_002228 [Pythium insidiosum]|nr:hypothetical protein ATCC90586_002228 [Pythium insidiosum]
MANVVPTAAELADISLACDRLWHLDSNRLEPGVHYELNLQEGKSCWQHGDVAEDPLFTFVDQSIFTRRTYKLFFDLLDNYERGVGVSETVTMEELTENNAFLNAVLDSAPMRYAYNWLVKNKKFAGDISAFKKKLDSIWFGLYRRQARNDSSGFEHVFIGEEKDGKICGCHNWIQIYNEERHGRLNYLGYIKPKQVLPACSAYMAPHNKEQVIQIQFMWEKEVKPVSTSLVGVSPEFEMALYTLCFLNGQEENHVQLGPYRVCVKCFSFGRGHDVKIGTAFPDALPMTEDQAASKIQAVVRGRRTRHELHGHEGHHHNGNPQQHQRQQQQQQRQPPPAPAGNAWNKPLQDNSKQQQQQQQQQQIKNEPVVPVPAGGAWSKPLHMN